MTEPFLATDYRPDLTRTAAVTPPTDPPTTAETPPSSWNQDPFGTPHGPSADADSQEATA